MASRILSVVALLAMVATAAGSNAFGVKFLEVSWHGHLLATSFCLFLASRGMQFAGVVGGG